MKRTAIHRRVALPRVSKFGNSRCRIGDRYYDSRLEARVAEMLHARERAGEIRNLREQVRHELYLAPLTATNQIQFDRIEIVGWCSCIAPGKPAPYGFKKFRGVRLDFEYEELRGDSFAQISADAKGFVQRDGGQFYAYQIFELIHGRPVQLLKKEDMR